MIKSIHRHSLKIPTEGSRYETSHTLKPNYHHQPSSEKQFSEVLLCLS